jgi:hypothetical protein
VRARIAIYPRRFCRADLRRSHPTFDGLNIRTAAVIQAAVNAAPANFPL